MVWGISRVSTFRLMWLQGFYCDVPRFQLCWLFRHQRFVSSYIEARVKKNYRREVIFGSLNASPGESITDEKYYNTVANRRAKSSYCAPSTLLAGRVMIYVPKGVRVNGLCSWSTCSLRRFPRRIPPHTIVLEEGAGLRLALCDHTPRTATNYTLASPGFGSDSRQRFASWKSAPSRNRQNISLLRLFVHQEADLISRSTPLPSPAAPRKRLFDGSRCSANPARLCWPKW